MATSYYAAAVEREGAAAALEEAGSSRGVSRRCGACGPAAAWAGGGDAGRSGDALESFYEAARRRRNRDLRDRIRERPDAQGILDLLVEEGELWEWGSSRWRRARKLLMKSLADADARQCANNMWSLASMKVQDKPLIGQLASCVLRRLSSLNTQEASNCCWAFATVKWGDDLLFRSLAQETLAKLSCCSNQDVTNTLWAFAAVSCAYEALFQLLGDFCMAHVVEFKAQECANTIWALATATFNHGALVLKLSHSSLKRLGEFSTQNLANFLWAYAKLAYEADTVLCGMKTEAWQRLTEFSTQDLVTTAWSLGTAMHCDNAFFRDCTAALHEHTLLQPQHISNSLWALALVPYHGQSDFQLLCRRAIEQISEFKPQECANAIWAIAAVPVKSDELVCCVTWQISRTIQDISTQSLANFMWAYAKLGYEQEAVLAIVQGEAPIKLDHFSEQDLSTTVWAFATAQQRDDAFLKRCIEALKGKVRLQAMRPQHASNTLWALATVPFYDVPYFCIISASPIRRVREFSAQDFASVLWACATCLHRDEALAAATAGEGARRLGTFDPQSLGQTVWALSPFGTQLEEFYACVWEHVEQSACLLSCNDKVLSMLAHGLMKAGREDLAWRLFGQLEQMGVDPGVNAAGILLHWCRHRHPDGALELRVLAALAKGRRCQHLAAAVLGFAVLRARELRYGRLAQRLGALLTSAGGTACGLAALLRGQLALPGGGEGCDIDEVDWPALPRSALHNSRTLGGLRCDYAKECQVLQHVLATATLADAESVIKSIESFSMNGQGWLKVAGDAKGAVLDDLMLVLCVEPPRLVLEFGCYVGYSATRMARLLRAWGGRLVSIEVDPIHVCLARHILEFAGVGNTVDIYLGHSEEAIPELRRFCGSSTADVVFMDQRGTRFHTDLLALEEQGLLSAGCVVAADNVLKPGAPHLLWYLQESPKYDMLVVSLKEFAAEKVEDWVAVARYMPSEGHAGCTVQYPAALSQLAFLTDRVRRRACAEGSTHEVDEDEWARHAQEMRCAYAAAGICPRVVHTKRRLEDGVPFVEW